MKKIYLWLPKSVTANLKNKLKGPLVQKSLVIHFPHKWQHEARYFEGLAFWWPSTSKSTGCCSQFHGSIEWRIGENGHSLTRTSRSMLHSATLHPAALYSALLCYAPLHSTGKLIHKWESCSALLRVPGFKFLMIDFWLVNCRSIRIVEQSDWLISDFWLVNCR